MNKKLFKRLIPAILTVLMVCTVYIPQGSVLAAEETEPPQPEPQPGLTDVSEGFEISFDVEGVAEKDRGIYSYTGDAIAPSFKVMDVRDPAAPAEVPDTSYTVTLENNTAPGKADITVTGKEEADYTGMLKGQFTIVKTDLSDAEVSLEAERYLYTGSEIKPDVTVTLGGRTLVKDRDYTVEYKRCLYPGYPWLEIKGAGGYEGSIEKDYRIDLPGTFFTGITKSRDGSISMRWDATEGAGGYLIYRSDRAVGGYKLIRHFAGGSYTSWTDDGCDPSKTYYYRIRTYRVIGGGYYYSSFTRPASAGKMLSRPSSLKAVFSKDDEVSLSWSAVKGAEGYIVYRSTSKKGYYEEIAKTGADVTSLVEKVTGDSYYYRVAAYRDGGRFIGVPTDPVFTTSKIAQVKWDSSRTRDFRKSVRLAWYEVPGATGYEIYKYNSSTDQYELETTINSGKTTTYSYYDLRELKTYYKVRAFVEYKGSKRYGPFSTYHRKTRYGWNYSGSYKLYFDSNSNPVKDVRKYLGRQSSWLIKINKYRNTVTVFAKDGNNGYIIPAVTFACSTGSHTPTGTFYTPAKYRWKLLMGPSYGQWCTRIYSSYLIHSIWYHTQNNKTMPVAEYNKLGTKASHGCIRMRAGDCKWIYDNCRLKTKVIIYNSRYDGPYGKPSYAKLPSWHRWDPTDPYAKAYCKQHHCHGY